MSNPSDIIRATVVVYDQNAKVFVNDQNAQVGIAGIQGPPGPQGPAGGGISLSGVTLVTGIQVTGSNPSTGLINITYAGDIRTFKSGDQIIISGDKGAGTSTITPIEFGTLSGNLISSGSFLDNRIISLSGKAGQTGNFVTTFQTGGLADAGKLIQTGDYLDHKIISLSGNTVFTFQTGNFADAGNLIKSGSFLDNRIISLTGQLNTSGDLLESKLNSLSGITVKTAQTGGFADAGNLIQTGNYLDRKIISLSGSIHANDLTGLQVTGSSTTIVGLANITVAGTTQIFLSGQNIVISGATAGGGSPTITPAEFGVLSGNLITTGSFLDNRIISLSGKVNTDINNLVTTGDYLDHRIISLSGNTVFINQTGGFADAGNLIKTGSFLDNRIISLSGNVAFASQTGGFADAGKLAQTGSFLDNRIISLSGSIYNNNLTGIQVSGGTTTIIGLANITYAGDVRVIQSGQTIIFSGSQTPAGGGEANTASNLGNGSGWFQQKSSVDLQFKSVMAVQGIDISGDSNLLLFRTTGVTFNSNTGVFVTTFQTGGFADAGKLIITGSFLDNRIIGLSGNSVLIYGNQTISGIKVFNNNNSNELLILSGNFAGFQELNITNKNTGNSSSSDVVVTADFGTDTTGYIDMGINSSNYNAQTVGVSGDAYLYSLANNLYIGNLAANRSTMIFGGINPTGFSTTPGIMVSGDKIGVNTPERIYNFGVSGSGNFSQGIYWNNQPVLTGVSVARSVTGISVTGSVGISGLVNITAAGTTQVFISGQSVIVSGAAGGGSPTITPAEFGTLSGNLITTGAYLDNRIISLSGSSAGSTLTLGKVAALAGGYSTWF